MRFLVFVVVLASALSRDRLKASTWSDPYAGRPSILWWDESDYTSSDTNRVVLLDQRGRLYLGKDGISVYDGRTWSQIDVNGAYATRALALGEDGRIWVGAIDEVGYLDNPDSGPRHYHSLVDKVPTRVKITDVWNVFRFKGKTLFSLNDGVLIWDGQQFEYKAMPNPQRLFTFPFRGGIGISQKGTGFWKWNGDTFTPITLGGMEKESIAVVIPLADGSELLDPGSRLGRLRDGVFSWEESDAARLLTDAGIVMSVSLPGGFTCVVSFTRGLIILAPDGTVARVIDRHSGLPGLNPLRAVLDEHGDLWVALAQAVARIDVTGDVSIFDSKNGFEHGPTGRIAAFRDRVLTLSNEGVCTLDAANTPDRGARLTPIPGLQDLYFDAVLVPDSPLLLSGRRRIVRLDHGTISKVYEGERDMSRMTQLSANSYAVADGSTVYQMSLGSAEPKDVRTVFSDLPEFIVDLAIDKHDWLWAVLIRKGIYAANLNDPNGHRVEGFLPSPEFAQPPYDRSGFTLAGDAYVYSPKQVFQLSYRGGPVATQVLNGFGLDAAEKNGDDDLWAVASRENAGQRLVHLTQKGGELTMEIEHLRHLDSVGRIGSISRQPGTSILWLGGSRGVLRVDLDHLEAEPEPVAPVILSTEWNADGTTVDLASPSPSLDYDSESTLRFEIRDGRNILDHTDRLEVRLAGVESTWRTDDGERSYLGLREGDYTFEARAVDFRGNPGPTASLPFVINPPWQRSSWAYLAYALLAAGAVWGGIQLRLKRIARLNAELERLVNRRTEELTRAVAARSAFLATMGHEIRNPLNGVIGLIDTLRSHELADDQQPVVDRISDCANQLESAVEDVLEFSRIDAGRISVKLRPFEIREPLNSAVEIFRASGAGDAIELKLPIPEPTGQIVGDPDRIRQVLVNYIANAIKFGGGEKVVVSAQVQGSSLTMAVTDRGPGIPKDEQARLFVRFSRGTLAYKTEIPGTGLGLAACKAYADAMGGEVWVESELGKGSTFYLRVPYQLATDENRMPTVVAPDIMVGRSALVVDDHDFNRLVLSDLLGRMGAKAATAGDVPSAKEVFDSVQPDIVFVDFDLPGSNGADLARWIRTEARAGRDVPVVATSAFEVDEVRRRCAEAGMDGFIAKPVTPQKVAEVMSRIETIRVGGVACVHVEPAPSSQSGFLDLLSDGDPNRRKELELNGWRDMTSESIQTLRSYRALDLGATATHAHRLVSAALMLGLREVVSTAREVDDAARKRDETGLSKSIRKLRQALRATRDQRKV